MVSSRPKSGQVTKCVPNPGLFQPWVVGQLWPQAGLKHFNIRFVFIYCFIYCCQRFLTYNVNGVEFALQGVNLYKLCENLHQKSDFWSKYVLHFSIVWSIRLNFHLFDMNRY